jgi:hypothetical protein
MEYFLNEDISSSSVSHKKVQFNEPSFKKSYEHYTSLEMSEFIDLT